jgi:hypothetical protein
MRRFVLWLLRYLRRRRRRRLKNQKLAKVLPFRKAK